MCSARNNESDINGEYEDLMVSLRDLRYCLKTLSFTLNYYRNLYSHSRAIETRSEDIISRSRKSERLTGLYLKKICTVSARRVKMRFSDKDNRGQAGMIDDSSLKFITEGKVIIHTKTIAYFKVQLMQFENRHIELLFICIFVRNFKPTIFIMKFK